MSGKRDQAVAPPPRLPELVHAGTIEVRHDLTDEPVLFLEDWGWSDPAGRRGRLPPGHSLAGAGGRSVKELHEISHGAGCECSVDGFIPEAAYAGEEREYAHDEPLPYHPDMWEEAR